MTLDSQRVHPNWLEDDRLRAIAELEGKDIRTLCEEMAEWQRKEQREIRDAHIQAGLRIDAATAEVNWTCTKIGDPYGFSAVMPWHASGKTYWACSLDEGTWVPFDDLPVATALALWEKHRSKLARPEGCALEDDKVGWFDRLTEHQKSFLQTREEAGLRIDPETAEVMWTYGRVGDPYRMMPWTWDACIGREYWARAPGSDIWVCFDDLPEATMEALLTKHSSKLDFPAGLEFLGEPPGIERSPDADPARMVEEP